MMSLCISTNIENLETLAIKLKKVVNFSKTTIKAISDRKFAIKIYAKSPSKHSLSFTFYLSDLNFAQEFM